MIDVTAAVCQQDGKILICQRPAEKNFGLLWEFPGGKAEANETLEECLKRELREELAFEVKDLRLLDVVEKADVGIRLHFLRVSQIKAILENLSTIIYSGFQKTNCTDIVFALPISN